MHQWIRPALVQMMAWCLFGAKPLSKSMPAYCQLDSWEQIFVEFESEFSSFSLKKMHLKLSSAKMPSILSRGRWVQWISNWVHIKTWRKWPMFCRQPSQMLFLFKNNLGIFINISLWGLNGWVISSHTLQGMWLFIHVGIKVKPCL